MDIIRTESPQQATKTGPHWFIQPDGFNPDKTLPPALKGREDEARHVVNTIARKMICRDVDESGYARLNSVVLRRTLSARTHGKLIEHLKSSSVIETEPHRADHYSRRYRLTPPMLACRATRRACHDLRLLKRIQGEQARLASEAQERRLPIHDLLAKAQQGLTVAPEADQIAATFGPYAMFCQDCLLQTIRRREFPFHVSEYGRCFNALTGVKRELRRGLRLGGDSMVGIDLRCAQPALLALLIQLCAPTSSGFNRTTYKAPGWCRPDVPALLPWLPRDLPSVAGTEIGFFSDIVCGGVFNKWLADACDLDIDKAKVAFLRDVLAKKGNYPSDMEIGFRSQFPTVHAFIRAANRKYHGTLIRCLQRLEAWLVIEQISPKLIEKVPIVTLHDAIFCRERDSSTVQGAFAETFEQIGFNLQTKTEYWGPPEMASRKKRDKRATAPRCSP